MTDDLMHSTQYEKASEKRRQVAILVVFVSYSKLAALLHAAFVSVEKHCPVICFAGLLFVFEKQHMGKSLSFPSGIFWRCFVKQKTKETLQITDLLNSKQASPTDNGQQVAIDYNIDLPSRFVDFMSNPHDL